jgi:hypothetical protein
MTNELPYQSKHNIDRVQETKHQLYVYEHKKMMHNINVDIVYHVLILKLPKLGSLNSIPSDGLQHVLRSFFDTSAGPFQKKNKKSQNSSTSPSLGDSGIHHKKPYA